MASQAASTSPLTSSQESAADSANPPRKVKIYTKTGDKGTTSLFTGERLPKDTDYFQALGDIDEVNAEIGLAREHCLLANIPTLPERLEEIQSRLFDMGAHVATPLSKAPQAHKDRTKFDENAVSVLEQWIDEMDAELPPLRNFILPGGGLASAQLHVARAVARRCERCIVPLVLKEDVTLTVEKYINRLSDFLFVAARYAAHKANKPEMIWKKARERKPATEEPRKDTA